MAFVVEDFQALMALLRANPEWLAELRQVLIGEFWQPLRDEVTALAETVRRGFEESEKRFAEIDKRFAEIDKHFEEIRQQFLLVDKRFEQMDKRFEQMDKRFEQMDKRFEQMDKRFEQMDQRFDRLETRVGDVEGLSLEAHVRANAPGFFGRIVRRSRVVLPGNLEPLLAAADDGRLSDAEWEQLMRLDVLLTGRRDDVDVMLAIEVSAVIDGGDVSRALKRAALLQRVGFETSAAVVGKRITPAGKQRAQAAGVLVHIVA